MGFFHFAGGACVIRRLLATSTIFLFCSNAFGAQYQISATGTSLPGPGGAGTVTTTDWTLVFNDTSGDGLLQVSEIVAFSGTAVTDSVSTTTFEYDTIVGTPAINGISTLSGVATNCPCWWFTGPVTNTALDAWNQTRWTYSKTEISSSLIEVDLNAVGDGLLTLDTSTGLEWLDLDQTFGRPYNDVAVDESLKGAGFRNATPAEVESLMRSANVFENPSVADAQAFIALVSQTRDFFPGTDIVSLTSGLHNREPFSQSSVAYTAVSISADPETGALSAGSLFNDESVNLSSSKDFAPNFGGNWLVRNAESLIYVNVESTINFGYAGFPVPTTFNARFVFDLQTLTQFSPPKVSRYGLVSASVTVDGVTYETFEGLGIQFQDQVSFTPPRDRVIGGGQFSGAVSLGPVDLEFVSFSLEGPETIFDLGNVPYVPDPGDFTLLRGFYVSFSGGTCPGLCGVAGIATFSIGVFPDGDGDGVDDSTSDLCLNTSIGDSVDTNGCSDLQVDGDTDGYCDVDAPSAGPSACVGTDNCPTVSNADQIDSNDDGFGDACVDPSVTIVGDVDPTVVVGADSSLNKDIVIAENVVLGSMVTVDQNTKIGADTQVGDGSTLKKNVTVGENGDIGSNVTVGQGAVLGVSVTLEDNVKVDKLAVVCDGATVRFGLTVGQKSVVDTGEILETDRSINQPGRADAPDYPDVCSTP